MTSLLSVLPEAWLLTRQLFYWEVVHCQSCRDGKGVVIPAFLVENIGSVTEVQSWLLILPLGNYFIGEHRELRVSDPPLTSGLEPPLVLVSATCSLHLLPQVPHSAFFPFSKLCHLLSHVLFLTCLAKTWSSFKTQYEYFSSRKAGPPFVSLEHIKCIETDWPSYMPVFLLSPWATEGNSLYLYLSLMPVI